MAPKTKNPKRPRRADVLQPEVLDRADPKDERQIAHLDPLDGHEEVQVESKALSIHDPLKRYLFEVSKHALITPEEEIELAKKMHDDGDIDAAKKLVQANLRLVVKIAMEYRTIYQNTLDLIQEGNVGLMKAVSKFDPSKGARLSYYSSWWIRSYILKFIIDNFRLVKIGTTQAQKKLFYNLMKEKARLETQGIAAPPKLLADKFNVNESDVIEMEQRLSSRGAELSLDSPLQSDEPSNRFIDSLADETQNFDVELEQNQLLGLLKEHLPDFEKTLSERERMILGTRILSESQKTLQEIADDFHLTRERVRQLETQVIDKLKEFLAPFLNTEKITLLTPPRPKKSKKRKIKK